MGLFTQFAIKWHVHRAGRVIRRHGFQAIYVGDYSRDPPAWAYTVGFDETLNHPELVVFDMPKLAAAGALAHVYDEVQAGRMRLEDGALVEGANVRCAWRKVHPDQIGDWLPLACFRRHAVSGKRYGLEAFQMVLGDPQGVLPWEPGYDESLRSLQPALYQPAGA